MADLRTAEARIAELEEALRPFAKGARHTRVFLVNKEKMHPTGVRLWDEDVARAIRALIGSSDYLARRDREVREKALLKAVAAVNAAREDPIHSGQVAFVDGVRKGHDRSEAAILALIEKEEPCDE